MLCGDIDDITLSGAHGKFAPTVFTSTPRRSVAFERRSEVGGSKLQRRLSLAGDFPTHSEKLSTNQIAGPKKSANEISKAMPHLKIGSTIAEETEEEEKENSFISPYRKKQRQALTPRPSSHAHIHPEPMPQQLPKNASQPLTENPWDEEKRKRVLRAAHVMVECHDFLNEKCPRIEVNRTTDLGGESFYVEKLLGQGGFARAYKAISRENCRAYAIKYEASACPWEVFCA